MESCTVPGLMTSLPAKTLHVRAWAQIHLCVFLWGFTAILGKLITLSALPLVWWRMLCVSLLLMAVPRARRGVARLSPKQRTAFAGVGIILSLHWLTFYGAIKLANASVAATCIALGPVFLAVIEPWVAGRSFDRRELIFGLVALPGVGMVVGGTPTSMQAGVAVGVVSAALVALFGSLNKRFLDNADVLSVTLIEMASGVITLTVIALLVPTTEPMWAWPSTHDAALLVVLSLACTLLPFSLSLVALRQLSAFEAQLAVNLEPVYAIGMAALLFGEQRELTLWFYVGVAILLVVVFGHAAVGRRGRRVGQ